MAQLRLLVLVLCTVLVLAHSAEGATRRRHAREAPPPEPDMPQRAAPAAAPTGQPLTPEQRRAHEEDLRRTEESDRRMAEAMERARPPRRAVISHEEHARRLAQARAKEEEAGGASRPMLQRHDTRTGVETLVATGEVINREPHAPAGEASTRATTEDTAAAAAHDVLRANGLSEVPDTRAAPFRSIGRMYYQFGEFTYICSGAFVKPRLFLTAAHCVFDHESNSYATDIVIVPGQTDRFFPNADTAGFGAAMERPRGQVKAAQVLTYSPYTDHEDYDWDMALILTDRNPRTSFVPADAGDLPAQLRQVSYPGGTYTDTDTPEMFQQSRRGGWESSGTSAELIEHEVASFQGDSGGPVFEEGSATDYVRAVVSHGFVGQLVPTFQCRVSDSKFDDIQDTWNDAPDVPNRPYLVPYMLGDTSSMAVSAAGTSITVTFALLNNGWAETGIITYSVRASLDPFITSSDTLLTDGTLNTLEANTFRTSTITATEVPSSISSGEYYIGVLWTTANTQYDNDNRRLIAGQLNVTNSGKRRHMRWFAYYATRIAPLLVCAFLWL